MKDLKKIRSSILDKRKLQFDIKKLRKDYEKSPSFTLLNKIINKQKDIDKYNIKGA